MRQSHHPYTVHLFRLPNHNSSPEFPPTLFPAEGQLAQPLPHAPNLAPHARRRRRSVQPLTPMTLAPPEPTSIRSIRIPIPLAIATPKETAAVLLPATDTTADRRPLVTALLPRLSPLERYGRPRLWWSVQKVQLSKLLSPRGTLRHTRGRLHRAAVLQTWLWLRGAWEIRGELWRGDGPRWRRRYLTRLDRREGDELGAEG